MLYGAGNGQFTALANPVPATVVSTNEPRALAVGRINGDALDDIAVVNHEEVDVFGLVVLLGLSRNRFTVNDQFTVADVATTVTLADFNNDTFTDIFLGTDNPATQALYIGDGTGNFPEPDPFTIGNLGAVQALASGNIGGDALPDLVAALQDGMHIRVAINSTNEPTETPGTPSPGTEGPTATPTPSPTGPTPTPSATPPPPTPTATATPTAVPTAPFSRCDLRVADAQQGSATLTGITAGPWTRDRTPIWPFRTISTTPFGSSSTNRYSWPGSRAARESCSEPPSTWMRRSWPMWRRPGRWSRSTSIRTATSISWSPDRTASRS